MRLVRPLLVIALALAATPALAYTIYLKDGSRLVAQEKYEIRGDKAIIVLPSGAKSMIDADEIDVERTEEANQSRLSGTAMLIEGGETTDLKEAAPPPPKKPRLQDLIATDQAGIREPERKTIGAIPRTGADLNRAPSPASSRAPYPDASVSTEIRGFATARGLTALSVHQGPRARRPLIVFKTTSEGAVFKALVVSANALLHLRSKDPSPVDGIDLVCETPNGGMGGRFELTPQLARDLVNGTYEITRFYVENVRF
jgi:hypothetical protein